MKATKEQLEIAVRAYEIWERSGRQPGRDNENWQQAEQELALEQRVCHLESRCSSLEVCISVKRDGYFTRDDACAQGKAPEPVWRNSDIKS